MQFSKHFVAHLGISVLASCREQQIPSTEGQASHSASQIPISSFRNSTSLPAFPSAQSQAGDGSLRSPCSFQSWNPSSADLSSSSSACSIIPGSNPVLCHLPGAIQVLAAPALLCSARQQDEPHPHLEAERGFLFFFFSSLSVILGFTNPTKPSLPS